MTPTGVWAGSRARSSTRRGSSCSRPSSTRSRPPTSSSSRSSRRRRRTRRPRRPRRRSRRSGGEGEGELREGGRAGKQREVGPGGSHAPGNCGVALAIAAFLVAFLVIPVVTVVYTAFSDGQGGFTLAHFSAFSGISLMRESFANSLYVAGMTVGLGTSSPCRSPISRALPVPRRDPHPDAGVLPLVMPAFVGAAAMQLLFGRSGSVNLILKDAFGVTLPSWRGSTASSSWRRCTTFRYPPQTFPPRSPTSTPPWRRPPRTSRLRLAALPQVVFPLRCRLRSRRLGSSSIKGSSTTWARRCAHVTNMLAPRLTCA